MKSLSLSSVLKTVPVRLTEGVSRNVHTCEPYHQHAHSYYTIDFTTRFGGNIVRSHHVMTRSDNRMGAWHGGYARCIYVRYLSLKINE